MFKDLSINLAASVIYDFTKTIITEAAKLEAVKFVLKKMGLDQTLSDFPERYTETLVELRMLQKRQEVLEFFRDPGVIEAYHEYYYADEATGLRRNDLEFYKALYVFVEGLKSGEDLTACNINIDSEIKEFHEIFGRKVHENRTVSETEFLHLLQELMKTTNSNTREILEEIKSKNIERVVDTEGAEKYTLSDLDLKKIQELIREVHSKSGAGKVYNIEKIENAIFN